MATGRGRVRWDLTALLNAADARASAAERHIWLIRLVEWLRHRGGAGIERDPALPPATPLPVLKLRHLLNVLDKNEHHREPVRQMLRALLAGVRVPTLLADFGFAPRVAFVSELAERLRLACLPVTPETDDLGAVFHLVFTSKDDAAWLEAIDDDTLRRIVDLLDAGAVATAGGDWRDPYFDAITVLAAQMCATGFSSAMRQRMDPAALAARPFQQLARSADHLRDAAAEADPARLRQSVQYLRALLEACRQAADSVRSHLEEYGVSVDVVFQVDQLRARAERIDALLTCVLAHDPARETLGLLAHLVRVGHQRRSLRALFARHYSLLARKVAERNAETGETYIARTREAWFAMLARALGGGAVIAGTTYVKFLVTAIGFSVFWAGWWAGVNYALSFVLIHLMHWTVATKQPAMTAPAMAAKLASVSTDADVESVVDEVACLIRTQVAGVVGNIAMCAPVALLAQGVCWLAFDAPLIGERTADYALHSLTLLGPTLLYAAFTGLLLFAASLIGGWVENWFVWHRLDSAIEWNPRIVTRLGAPRARYWARWWRTHVSGIASNVSLGLMLGLVPALCAFFGLPIEVRHVTLSTGQLAAAAGTHGIGVLHLAGFWWCLAAIPLTAALNVGVSFFCAFKLALRSRGLQHRDRSRLYAAIRRRLLRAPLSFLWPTHRPVAVAA